MVLLILSIVFLFSILFSSLVLIIPFLLLVLDLVYSSFSSFWRWKVKLLIFLNIHSYNYTFPSYTAFATLSWVLVCCVFIFIYFKTFSDFPCNFFFDMLVFLKNVLFNFYIFVAFPVFLLVLISSFILLLSEKILVWFKYLKIINTYFCGLIYGLSGRMFLMHLKKICILLWFGGVFHIYVFGPMVCTVVQAF